MRGIRQECDQGLGDFHMEVDVKFLNLASKREVIRCDRCREILNAAEITCLSVSDRADNDFTTCKYMVPSTTYSSRYITRKSQSFSHLHVKKSLNSTSRIVSLFMRMRMETNKRHSD